MRTSLHINEHRKGLPHTTNYLNFNLFFMEMLLKNLLTCAISTCYGIVLRCDQNLEKHYCEGQQHALPGALDTCANGQKCMLQISTQTDIMHDTISLAVER